MGGFYDPDLVAQGSIGSTLLETGSERTVIQKKYIEESKKLYATMFAMKRYYKETIEPTNGISFEDMFLNNDPNNRNYRAGYTMGSLYDMFRDYLPKETGWAESSNIDQAKTDLEKVPTLDIVSRRGVGLGIPATIYDYPITINAAQPVDGKNKYVFFLAGVTDPAERVEYTVGDDENVLAEKLKSNIENRLKNYLKGVKFVDQNVPAILKYENGEWFFPVTTKAEHLIKSTTGVVKLKFDEKGEIQLMFEGQGITVLTSKDLPSQDLSLVIDMFIVENGAPKSNFDVLRAVSKYITIANNNPGAKTFDILLFGETIHVSSANNKYEINTADQQRLIKNESFREKYADARINSNEYKEYIDTIRSIVDQVNSMSFGTKVVEGTKATMSNFWQMITTDASFGTLFNGKIPNNYMDMTLASQMSFLENLLASEMAGAKDLEGLKGVEGTIKNRFSRIKAFEATIRDNIPQEALSSAALRAFVIDPLRGMSYNSGSYTQSVMRFEKEIITRVKLSDVNKESVSQASKLWDVYYHFTAKLDKPELDISEEYNPYTGEIPFGLKANAYLKDVRTKIGSKMNQFLSGNFTGDYRDWGIEEFENWDSPALHHEVSENVPLDSVEIGSEIDLAFAKVTKLYENNKYRPVVLYLYNSYKNSGFGDLVSQVSAGTDRTSQFVFINDFAEKFKNECDRAIKQAIDDKLDSRTSWIDRIPVWAEKYLPKI